MPIENERINFSSIKLKTKHLKMGEIKKWTLYTDVQTNFYANLPTFNQLTSLLVCTGITA